MLVTDTKNRAGLIQSEGALVDAAAFTVTEKQKLLTLVQAQQASKKTWILRLLQPYEEKECGRAACKPAQGRGEC